MRTVVVTGSASGIGRATKDLLEHRGDRVIGVDIHESDIVVDLATPSGRADLVERVRELSGGTVDAIAAIAGLANSGVPDVAVNYFGAIATLEGLRPLLAGSSAPRAFHHSVMRIGMSGGVAPPLWLPTTRNGPWAGRRSRPRTSGLKYEANVSSRPRFLRMNAGSRPVRAGSGSLTRARSGRSCTSR